LISEYSQKAEARLGSRRIELGEWVMLAHEAEEKSHFFEAAVYYHIAALASTPGPMARTYEVLSEEMQERMAFGWGGWD
jgi:hypothetical protein